MVEKEYSICDRIFFMHTQGQADNILASRQEENLGP